jgi:transposase
MKVQEVILRALAKRITWWQAAEIIGISDRQMRRCRERYEEFGFRGLFDRRRGKPSPKRVPVATMQRVLELYREQYFDLNARHFHEKLKDEHQIELSYSWVKGVLQGAGLMARGRKRGQHRKWRSRRPLLCCCTSMAVTTVGFRMSVGMTGWNPASALRAALCRTLRSSRPALSRPQHPSFYKAEQRKGNCPLPLQPHPQKQPTAAAARPQP